MSSRTQRTPFGDWWWTVDRLMLGALAALMLGGIVLCLAASPPVAARLNLDAFHFVNRQVMFLIPAVAVLLATSLLSPRAIRRLALVVFFVSVLLVAATLTLMSVSAGAQEIGTNDYWMKYASRLPIGSTVKVRTTDGKRMTAVLAVVDDTGVTLQPKTRIPEPPRHVPFAQLAQIELREHGSGAGKAAAIGVSVGVGAFLGMLAILAASWD
jgi:hypothetical protein